jgi:hypothetical protein
VKRLRLIYEQLEEAKHYLQRGSSLHLRLALILTDNVGELLMFNALERTFSHDDFLEPLRRNSELLGIELDEGLQLRYSAEERAKAETEFEPMVRLLRDRLSKLSPSDATVLRIAHSLRRDAFHRGQLRAEILGPIAHLLFRTVVRLTETLGIADVVHTFPLDEEEKDFMGRFGLRDNLFHNSAETRGIVAKRLLEGTEFDLGSFRRTLTDELVGRTEVSLKQLSAICDEGRENEQLLRYQFAQEFRPQEKPLEWSDFDKVFVEWKNSATPKVTVEWLRQFRDEVARKLNSKDASQVLASYWGMDKLFAPKEDFVDKLDTDVDRATQFQIDIARGK